MILNEYIIDTMGEKDQTIGVSKNVKIMTMRTSITFFETHDLWRKIVGFKVPSNDTTWKSYKVLTLFASFGIYVDDVYRSKSMIFG